MTDLQTTLAKWEKLVELFQPRGMYRTALTGDGSSASTCDVDGRPGWAWVRYDEKQDKASQVLNRVMPGAPQDIPVVVGKQHPTDKHYQILDVNMDLYMDHLTLEQWRSYITPRHGPTHQAEVGSDPAPIDVGNFVFGKVQPTDPAGLEVYAEAFSYDADGVYQTWLGGTIDLTSNVPGVAATHRYVLVSVNTSTNALAATNGVVVPTPMAAEPPDVPLGYVPLALVELEQGDTTITAGMIYDYRLVLTPVGGYIDVINNGLGTLEATLQFQMDEMMELIQALILEVVDVQSELQRQLGSHIVDGTG